MAKRKKNNATWAFDLHQLNFEIIENLGPHAKRLYQENLAAADVGSWASVIILSATIIDVVTNEKNGQIDNVDGIVLNKVLNSKNVLWLRKKRNSIVHYEFPVDGMMGGANQTDILLGDARKSFQIMMNCLQELFENF